MVDFDVVELPEADHVREGETAPDFTRPLVKEEYWEDTALSDLTSEGPLLLVFYTMDGAFPSTYIWNEIRDRDWGEIITVVGISISTPYEHKEFIKDREMDYELFSDPRCDVGELYGVTHDLDGMAGIMEHRPSVFLMDSERGVKYAWVASEWPDFPDYDEIEEAIESV